MPIIYRSNYRISNFIFVILVLDFPGHSFYFPGCKSLDLLLWGTLYWFNLPLGQETTMNTVYYDFWLKPLGYHGNQEWNLILQQTLFEQLLCQKWSFSPETPQASPIFIQSHPEKLPLSQSLVSWSSCHYSTGSTTLSLTSQCRLHCLCFLFCCILLLSEVAQSSIARVGLTELARTIRVRVKSPRPPELELARLCELASLIADSNYPNAWPPSGTTAVVSDSLHH